MSGQLARQKFVLEARIGSELVGAQHVYVLCVSFVHVDGTAVNEVKRAERFHIMKLHISTIRDDT